MSSDPLRPDCPTCEGSGEVRNWNLSPNSHCDVIPCGDCGGEGTVPGPLATAPTLPAPASSRRWRYPEGGIDNATAILAGPRVALVMVGAAGSGKSSWLEEHAGDAAVCSADTFFYERGGGRYLFNPELLGDAHAACLRKWLRCINGGTELIAVDNTNLRECEFSPYIATALAYGYAVLIVRIAAQPAVCYARNKHSVPPAAINRMVGNFNQWSLPPHWRSDSRVTVLPVIAE